MNVQATAETYESYVERLPEGTAKLDIRNLNFFYGKSKALHGVDSLLSIVQMPAGVPVATLAIGRAGAVNAALLAAAILAGKHTEYGEALRRYRAAQTQAVLDHPDPREKA